MKTLTHYEMVWNDFKKSKTYCLAKYELESGGVADADKIIRDIFNAGYRHEIKDAFNLSVNKNISV